MNLTESCARPVIPIERTELASTLRAVNFQNEVLNIGFEECRLSIFCLHGVNFCLHGVISVFDRLSITL